MTSSMIKYTIQQGIGVVRIDNPPVNALSQRLRSELVRSIQRGQEDDSKALLIICDGRTFIAGADIREFDQSPRPPSLPELVEVLERSGKLVVAALHGSALGGGFELALACHYRCATSDAMVGLPEVRLGLLPGAGGTQRVPRLAGVEPALDLITSGKPVSAEHATSIGLVDRIVEGDLLAGALEYTRELVSRRAVLRKSSELSVETTGMPPNTFDVWRRTLKKRAPGQLAPQHIVCCIEAATTQRFEDGIQTERQLFKECRGSSESAAMRHLFFAERMTSKLDALPDGISSRPIDSVAIIGAGTMGAGIAMVFADAGISVVVLENDASALERGLASIRSKYEKSVARDRISDTEASYRLGKIKGTTDYSNIADVDLVVEAVYEDMEVKKAVFSKIEKHCKPTTILATNTSYLDIDDLAATTSNPRNVIGLHFFSPANVMRLLEVVQTALTADEVVATSVRLAKRLGKIPILAGVCYGFVGNRIFRQYMREANFCLLQGCSPKQIDSAMENWGMAMGPLAVGDLAGLDVSYKARLSLPPDQVASNTPFAVADALVESGRLGQKSGSGYYDYEESSRKRHNSQGAKVIVDRVARHLGIDRLTIGEDEIVTRLTCALINEGAQLLQEGIARRSSDIDVVFTNGYGFPAFRGGPMYYADAIGLQEVVESISALRTKYGDYWTPAPLLTELASSGGGFSDWQPQPSVS